MTTLKFEGFKIGDRIRAYDWEPSGGRDDSYIVGQVSEVLTADDMRKRGRDPFACYVVNVEEDTVPERKRDTVFVPMETTRDYDERVTLMYSCDNCPATFERGEALYKLDGSARCPDCCSAEVDAPPHPQLIALWRAAKVLELTPAIGSWLLEHDPKALEQLRAASLHVPAGEVNVSTGAELPVVIDAPRVNHAIRRAIAGGAVDVSCMPRLGPYYVLPKFEDGRDYVDVKLEYWVLSIARAERNTSFVHGGQTYVVPSGLAIASTSNDLYERDGFTCLFLR